MSAGHREIDHTADVGFEVWGATPEDLAIEATAGLCDLCYERSDVMPREPRELRTGGDGREQQLVRWLQEVYLLVEQEGWLTASVDRVAWGSGGLRGVLLGESLDAERHVVHTEIKAVTYHELAIRRGADDLLRTLVIVDV